MDYRTLGRAGVKVSPLCLGTMNFGGPTDETDAIRIIHRALDAGINFVDTADAYTQGQSEQIVGRAIKDRRDQVVLATKVHFPTGPGPNDRGNSRYHIAASVEASLRRLDTDRIDLYYLHRPDPDTPIDEQLAALDRLVAQGKVLYVGTSTFPAWQLCEAQWTSKLHGLERLVCEQPPYNIMSRYIEKEILPFCQAYGLAVIPWSPLGGGWLTGKYRKGQDLPEQSRGTRHRWDPDRPAYQRRLEAVEELIPLAEQLGVTLSQFALAWLLTNPAVTAPIIGPRTMDHLEDNLKALEVRIPLEVLSHVDRIAPPCSDLGAYE